MYSTSIVQRQFPKRRDAKDALLVVLTAGAVHVICAAHVAEISPETKSLVYEHSI